MKESKAKSENRGLVVLLCVLGLVVVGLIVGIVVVNIVKVGAEDLVSEEWSENVDCFENGTSYDIDVCIDDIYNSDAENDGVNRSDLVVGLYDKAIDEALSKEDYNEARELLVSRSSFFVMNDDCGTAISLLDDARVGGLEDGNKGVFYSYAVGISMDCENEESVAKWNNLLVKYNGETGDEFGI